MRCSSVARSPQDLSLRAACRALAFLVCGFVIVACQPVHHSRASIGRKSSELTAQSSLHAQASPLSATALPSPLRLVFVGEDARKGLLVGGVDSARVAVQRCTEWFVDSKNYVVGMWRVGDEAESDATAASDADAFQPHFLIEISVGMVERVLRADGSATEWDIGVGGSREEIRSVQGAIEVRATVTRWPSGTVVFTSRGIGPLDEESGSQMKFHLFGNDARTVANQLIHSEALRAATRALAGELDRFFGETAAPHR